MAARQASECSRRDAVAYRQLENTHIALWFERRIIEDKANL